jgi:hypothetical protein
MRGGEGCLWCASKGERREGKRGVAATGGALLNSTVGVRGLCSCGGGRRKEGGGGLAR